MKCKICGNADTRVIYQLTKSDLNVLRCPICGFTFSEYQGDEKNLASDGHGPQGVLDVDPNYCRKFQGRVQLYEKVCGPLRGKSVLDVGAGGGAWLMAALGAGAAVEGIELCQDCRSYARDVNRLALDDRPVHDPYWRSRAGQFDVVTSWDVLEHVPDPRGFLLDCISLVAPGGHLLFSTPVRDTKLDSLGILLYHCTFGRVQFILRNRYSRVHLQIFHSDQLKSLLVEKGLRPMYYRAFQEFSFPMEQYFVNVGFRRPRADLLGRLASWTIGVLPIENKIMGIFANPSTAEAENHSQKRSPSGIG